MKFAKGREKDGQDHWNYLSVGYYNGKAIIKNEAGRLYYIRCEECAAPIGTVVTGSAVTSIDKLPQEEQQQIQDIYGTKKD